MEDEKIKDIFSNVKIEDIFSYEEVGGAEEGELLEVLHQHIDCKAFVYMVMDHRVALGSYEKGEIQIELGLENKVTDLPLKYVQELRVFEENREFCALRIGGSFKWRLRVDVKEETPNFRRVSILDEIHKLWGAVRKEEEKEKGEWSLLSTKRGNAIYFPGGVKLHGEKGLVVRNYLQFNTADSENGLVQFVDERFCEFVDWSNEDGEV
ncbi:MAG: CRISPR-associated protein Csx19 [Clostridia bacterium]|nr:CRISPR-associated protein Csx19 [Clostridia bacterium]